MEQDCFGRTIILSFPHWNPFIRNTSGLVGCLINYLIVSGIRNPIRRPTLNGKQRQQQFPSTQLLICLSFLFRLQKELNLSSPGDWEGIDKHSISHKPGYRTLVKQHSGSFSKAVLENYHERRWDYQWVPIHSIKVLYQKYKYPLFKILRYLVMPPRSTGMTLGTIGNILHGFTNNMCPSNQADSHLNQYGINTIGMRWPRYDPNYGYTVDIYLPETRWKTPVQ